MRDENELIVPVLRSIHQSFTTNLELLERIAPENMYDDEGFEPNDQSGPLWLPLVQALDQSCQSLEKLLKRLSVSEVSYDPLSDLF